MQFNISSGMLRAFSLLVIIQYLLEEKTGEQKTVLIDDFGEGLDYERATKLAKLVFSKMKQNKIQFIATTNDYFLMNSVEIEYWNILQREWDKVKALNYINSKELFDKFRLTGLNNFDLFSSDFLKKENKK